MGTTNKKKIRAYCDRNGIFVPVGFDRHSASRYAIIRNDVEPPKLIAKTWSNQEDVVYFIENMLRKEVDGGINEAIDILDFKDVRRLRYRDSARLKSDGSFSLEPT
ncbi:MAG: hypothetical protein AAGA58_10165 [Verrucomicrobiota bacterium]